MMDVETVSTISSVGTALVAASAAIGILNLFIEKKGSDLFGFLQKLSITLWGLGLSVLIFALLQDGKD